MYILIFIFEDRNFNVRLKQYFSSFRECYIFRGWYSRFKIHPVYKWVEKRPIPRDWMDGSCYLDYHYPCASLRSMWNTMCKVDTYKMKSREHDRADRDRIQVVFKQVLCILCGYIACTLRMPDLRVSKTFCVLVFIRRIDRISSADRIEALAKCESRECVLVIIYSSSIGI